MPKPTTYNITFVQGDTYRLGLRFKDPDDQYVDVTGWDFNAQVRATYDSSTVMAQFTSAIPNQGDPDLIGSVTLTLSDTDTTDLPVSVLPDASGVWDVEVTFPDGDVRTYLTGKVTVKAQVSRA